MAETCPLSDLPADQCACRVHAEADEPEWSSAILAKHDGYCRGCDEEIQAGVDLIVTPSWTAGFTRCYP